jgi:hypothetical protein
MRLVIGSVNIGTATTRVQVNNKADRVYWIQFKANEGNSGHVFVGDSTVSATNGWSLDVPGANRPTGEVTFNFRGSEKGAHVQGSVPFSYFYVDAATNGDDVDYAAWTE